MRFRLLTLKRPVRVGREGLPRIAVCLVCNPTNNSPPEPDSGVRITPWGLHTPRGDSPVGGAVGGREDPVGQDERAAAQVRVVDHDHRLPRKLAAQRRRAADDLAADHLAQFPRRRGFFYKFLFFCICGGVK